MRIIISFLMVVLLSNTPLLAQEESTTLQYTRVAAAESQRPRASLGDLGWLIGHWEGPGIAGAPSQETWSRPLGGAMIGSFVQSDGKDGVMFSEHMQIAHDGESLVVRLKHFNADLTGWEEKGKVVSFPFVARDGDSWYFNGLTYRREGRSRLLVAVRMRGTDGKMSELVFRFKRVRG